MRLRVIDGELVPDSGSEVADIVVEVPASLLPKEMTEAGALAIVESVKVELKIMRDAE